MSDSEFSQFEEKKMQEFTQPFTTVSPVFPLTVFTLIDNIIGVAVKA